MALLVIAYLPFLHESFGTFSLTPTDWAIILPLAFSVMPALELTKWMVRRGWFGKLA